MEKMVARGVCFKDVSGPETFCCHWAASSAPTPAVFLRMYTHESVSLPGHLESAPGVLPEWTCFPLGSPGDAEDSCPVADSCVSSLTTSQQVLPLRPQPHAACELTGRLRECPSASSWSSWTVLMQLQGT